MDERASFGEHIFENHFPAADSLRSGWSASFVLDGGVPKLENIVVPGQGPMPLIDVTASLGKSAVTWTDLRWIREGWKGPIIVKGV
jgi:hypothetical protein